MRRLNKILALALILAFYLLLAQEAVGQKEELDSQKRLREEIQLLNLLSGLYLSEEQMSFLIDKAKETEQMRQYYKEQWRQYSDASTQTLERLKSEIVEDKAEVSGDVAREVHQTNKKILEMKADYEKKMERIAAEVKNDLTSTQLHIIGEFKPCLVPPKGPAKFGQADNPVGGVKQLERIREMPDNRYSLKKYELADRILERALLHKPKGAQVNEDQLRSKIVSIFAEARGLSEIDFNLRKEELAKKLKEEITPRIKKEVDVDVKIERFLLNPTIISILEERLRVASFN